MIDINFNLNAKTVSEGFGISNKTKDDIIETIKIWYKTSPDALQFLKRIVEHESLTDAEKILMIYYFGQSVGQSTGEDQMKTLMKRAIQTYIPRTL